MTAARAQRTTSTRASAGSTRNAQSDSNSEANEANAPLNRNVPKHSDFAKTFGKGSTNLSHTSPRAPQAPMNVQQSGASSYPSRASRSWDADRQHGSEFSPAASNRMSRDGQAWAGENQSSNMAERSILDQGAGHSKASKTKQSKSASSASRKQVRNAFGQITPPDDNDDDEDDDNNEGEENFDGLVEKSPFMKQNQSRTQYQDPSLDSANQPYPGRKRKHEEEYPEMTMLQPQQQYPYQGQHEKRQDAGHQLQDNYDDPRDMQYERSRPPYEQDGNASYRPTGTGSAASTSTPMRNRKSDTSMLDSSIIQRGDNSDHHNNKGSDDEGSSSESRRFRFLERNRVAASKCRQKKKEWTAHLESQARDLQKENNHLKSFLGALHDEISFLHQQCRLHTDCNCTDIQSFVAQSISEGQDMRAPPPEASTGNSGNVHGQDSAQPQDSLHVKSEAEEEARSADPGNDKSNESGSRPRKSQNSAAHQQLDPSLTAAAAALSAAARGGNGESSGKAAGQEREADTSELPDDYAIQALLANSIAQGTK